MVICRIVSRSLQSDLFNLLLSGGQVFELEREWCPVPCRLSVWWIVSSMSTRTLAKKLMVHVLEIEPVVWGN